MSFIHDYIDYTERRCDAPRSYKKYMAYAAIAGILADSSYLDLGYATIYPNLYLMLVGPSGKVRKSTAIRHMREIVTKVSPKILWSSSISDEGLLGCLQKNRTGMIIEGEFSTLMSGLDKKYAIQSKAILTDIFECPEIYPMPIRANQDEPVDPIKQPVLSIISASTPEWLLKHVRPDDVTGGFLGRFLFIYEEDRERTIPRGESDIETQLELANRLYRLRDKDFPDELATWGIESPWRPGPMVLSQEAEQQYAVWREEINRDVDESENLQKIHGVVDRITDAVHKFGIINAVADLTCVIRQTHMAEAIFMGNECIQTALQFLYKLAVMDDKYLAKIEMLRDALERAPEQKLTYRQVQRKLGVSRSPLKEIIGTLLATGEVTTSQNGRTTIVHYHPNEGITVEN